MKKTTIAVLALALVVALTGCGSKNRLNKHIAQSQIAVVSQDVQDIESQLLEMRSAEPLPRFHDSAALHVQNAYYTADADPNKIWYVTLVALDGTPYAHFTTKGAPQPAGDQVTNPQQLYCQHIGQGTNIPDGCGTVGLPEPNGVHSSAESQGYVAILTTGAMIRIPEGALISDQPFKVDVPVKLSIDETKNISATDESKTEGAVVPTGSGTRDK